MWKSKALLLYQNKRGNKYYVPLAASSDLRVLLFCFNKLFSPDVTDTLDYVARSKMLKLMRLVGLDCNHPAPARIFILLDFFAKNGWDCDERALPWKNVVGRLRAYLSHEPAVGQVFMHVLLRNLLKAAMYVYRRGRKVPKLRCPAYFRPDSRLPDYLHFPLYPKVTCQRSLKFALHVYQRLIVLNIELPNNRLRRLIHLVHVREASMGRSHMRPMRPVA